MPVTQIGLDDLRRVEDLVCRALRYQPPAVEHHDTVGKRPHHLEVVFNDQEGKSLGVQALQQFDGLSHFALVQARHDFVQQHDFWLKRQRPRHFKPAPLAQCQVAGADAGLVGKPHFFEHRHGFVARGR